MKIYNYIDKKILEEIVNVLDNDGLIIFPTDTVYGIACNSFSESAIKKIYSAKKRSLDKPICVLTNSIDKINMVVNNISSKEKELIDKYMPGNLTIVFNKKNIVPDILTANKNTIGVRIPNNDIALKILSSYPNPLAVTSVNISGNKCGTSLNDFVDEFSDKVDIIIDSGICNDTPSTIIKVIDNEIEILRHGSLNINML